MHLVAKSSLFNNPQHRTFVKTLSLYITLSYSIYCEPNKSIAFLTIIVLRCIILYDDVDLILKFYYKRR